MAPVDQTAGGGGVPVRVLLVEDSPAAAEVVRRRLLDADLLQVEVRHVGSLEEAAGVLGLGWDVVLLDLGLPGCEDLEALEWVRESAPQLPVVVLTAHDDPALAMRALAAEAQDYLVKARIDSDSLARAIRYAIGRQSTRRRSEELRIQLERSERLAAVGQLAAGVAHEVNNPLTYVTVNIDLALRELAALGRAGVNVSSTVLRLKDAREGASRVVRIVRDLGMFARVDADAEPRPVDVNAVLDSALNMAASHIKYRAFVHKELGKIPKVLATEGRLSQVFLNLLVNAGQSITEGHAAENRIDVRTYLDGGTHVVLDVCDTGHGISREHLEHLFEPFFSTKKVGEGSGLGLSICRSLLETYDGTIEAFSELGRGTTMRVRLPAFFGEDSDETSPSSAAPSYRPPGRRGRVLVVDDEPAILRVLVEVLSPDHDLMTAASGEEAKAMLRVDDRFDVVLCDVVMDDGTGVELFRFIEAEHPPLAPRVLFMTGGVMTSEAKELLAGLPDRIVPKPVETEALRNRIGEMLAE